MPTGCICIFRARRNGNGLRERLARNRELYEKHLGGAPVHKLAEEYYLSAKTIYKILASMRQA